MKKVLSCFLIVLFVFFLFTGCGETEENDPIEFKDLLSDEDWDVNFYGLTFNIYQHFDRVKQPFGYRAGTLFADMVMDRVAAIEKELNCTLNYRTVSDILQYVRNTSATGTTDADILYCTTCYYLMNLATRGLLHDYTKSDIIDTLDTEKYGPLNLQESIMLNGVTYGLIPMKWVNKGYEGNIGSLICFNEGIIKTYDMPNPRELHEQKKWWATEFTDLLPQYAVMEGQSPIYALSGHKCNFVRAVLGANGMKMVAEVDGKLVEAFDTPEVLRMLTWTQDFIAKNQNYINFLADYTIADEFIAQTCTLGVIETMWIEDIAQKIYDFGILPFPCGPDIEYDTQTTYYSYIDAFAIPSLSFDPEATENILVPLMEPFAGYEDEASVLELLDNSLFFNHADTIYYASLYKNTQAQYYIFDAYLFMESIASHLTSRSPVEMIASLKGTNDEVTEKYIAPNYYYIKEHTQP